jgi:hypothetical protein
MQQWEKDRVDKTSEDLAQTGSNILLPALKFMWLEISLYRNHRSTKKADSLF